MIAPAMPPKRFRPRPLETGDILTAAEFLRRWEELPELKKAELIEGVVYLMSSPVTVQYHSEPDSLIQGWLCNYSLATPGVKSGVNGTLKLDAENVLQPDGALRILAECGGRATLDEDGYLIAGPELVVEVSARSASAPLRDKLKVFARHGVPEVLIWRTADAQVEWLRLSAGAYHRAAPDIRGVIRSEVFPGLWLNVPALLRDDGATLMATLNLGLNSPAHRTFVSKLATRTSAKKARSRA